MDIIQKAFENEMIFIPSFLSDLDKTKNHEHWNAKFKLFFQMQIVKIIEQTSKVAYDHLEKIGKININREQHFFVDQEDEYIIWNPIGKALMQLPPASHKEMFIGYHAIEYYVDLFSNKTQSQYYSHFKTNPFNLVGDYSMEEIFKKSPFYKSESSTILRWKQWFDSKEWKHAIIYDQERFMPCSFMAAIRKWYAPCQYYVERENIMKLLKEEFILFLRNNRKYTMKHGEILNEPDIENNLYQIFLKKKLPLSHASMLKIHHQESYKFTTRELRSMETIVLYTNGERINKDDCLSPFFPHHFTLHGLEFENVHQYIWFRIFKMFSKNISRSHFYSTLPNYKSTFQTIMEKVEDRSLFTCCQENMNKLDFQLFLIENKIFSGKKMIQQSQEAIQSWSVNGKWIDEKLRFLNDWKTFCGWRTKSTCGDFEYFIKLFYPKLMEKQTNDMEGREFNISMDPKIEKSITNIFYHAVQNDFYLFPDFPEHFLSWLASMTKSFRETCLQTSFLSMVQEILTRHNFSYQDANFSLKSLQKTFSMAECLIIEELF